MVVIGGIAGGYAPQFAFRLIDSFPPVYDEWRFLMKACSPDGPQVSLIRYIGWGALQGAAAWSAYAVAEFVSSSLLFYVARPYATFTNWHWALTAQLVAAYLVAGLVAGALAGLVTCWLSPRWIRNPDLGAVLEGAATLTLVLAFALHTLSTDFSLAGSRELLLAGAVFLGLLLAALRSAAWSFRLGFLATAWVVSALLLGLGQGFAMLQMRSLASQLGAPFWVWFMLLVCLVLALAGGSMALGRRMRPRRDRFTLWAPSWVALGLAGMLLVGSAWLAAGPSGPVRAAAPVAASSGRPNFLVVVMDTVRADRLSIYGHPHETTPNLRRLAQDSLLYTQALAASGITLTSHASLFTGAYPSWHGAHCQPPEAAYGRALAPTVPTLAEMLATQGYATVGVSANLYLRADFGLQRGFQSFRIPRPVPMLPDESPHLLRRGMRLALNFFLDTAQFDRLFSRGEDVNAELLALLNQQDGSRPFFAFVNYMDAHFPYLPPAPYDQLFPGKSRGILAPDIEQMFQKVVQGEQMPAGGLTHTHSQYDGGIAYVDAQIGQVVEWLKSRKLYDNTMIVITSDHGEAFGEKRLVQHGNSVYQNLLHAPLLMKFPRGAHVGVENNPVSLIDVAPTLLGTAGIPIPAHLQGRNLLDPAAAAAPRRLFGESFPCPVLNGSDCPAGCLMRAVFAWPHKFITSSSGRRELYDLSSDPGEDRNLAASERETARALASELGVWMKAVPAQARQNLKLDGESLQRLKSLGYVQ